MSDDEKRSLSPAAVKKRQLLLLTGLVLVGVLLLYLSGAFDEPASRAKRPAPPVRQNVMAPGAQVDPKSAWVGLAEGDIKRIQERLDSVEKKLDKDGKTASPASALITVPPDPTKVDPQEPHLGDDKKYAEMEKQRLDSAKKKELPPPVGKKTGDAQYPPGNPGGAQEAFAAKEDTTPAQRSLSFVDVATATPAASPIAPAGTTATATPSQSSVPGNKATTSAPPRKKTVDNYLGIGHMPIEMLGGLVAPTSGVSQSNPIPIYFRVLDNGFLPNGFRSHMKECLGIGTGYGDLSSERAMLRTETLSCTLLDGQIIDIQVKGTVFGEDGQAGMRGKIVEKNGQMIANAAAAAVASGIGSMFSANATVQSISPLGSITTPEPGKQFQAGFGTGIGNGFNQLSQYYIRLADKTLPGIEIGAGRRGDLVIQKGAFIDYPADSQSANTELNSLKTRNRRMNRYGDND